MPSPAPKGPLPTPETKVVELRVHGIMGTTAAGLVDAVAAVDVAGDRVGRIVRPADRLLRPAPGAVLQASGRSTPRTVEGYQWRRMTSGGWAKAIWALLFPFSLANLAYWMLPPIPQASRAAHVLGGCARGVLRLAALLLTMLFVAQVEVVSLDLFAVHCLAPGASCVATIPGWVGDSGALRALAGLLPVVLVILVLHRVSTVNWKPLARLRRPGAPTHQVPELPGDNVVADPDTPALRGLHTCGALAVAALLALGDPTTAPGSDVAFGCWVAALTLAGLSLVGALLLDDPSGGRPELGGRWLRAVLGPVGRSTLIALAAASLVTTGVLRGAHPAAPAGSSVTVEGLGAGIVACCVSLGLLLVPAALLARGTWAHLPRRLRPWAGGMMALPALVLAGMLGGGFGAGVGIAVRTLLGPNVTLPYGYDYITLLWGLAAASAVAVTPVLAGATALRRLLRGPVTAEEVRLLHPEQPEDAKRADRAAWLAAIERNHLHHLVITLAAALAAGAIVAIVLLSTGIGLPPWARAFSAIGVAGLGALALGLLRAVFLAARRPDSARHLGSIVDLASFWPREAHPIVPPCYALKVVPELAARAAEHLRDPNTRVVLSGHSHGALLVAVAASRLLHTMEPATLARLGVVTAGAPLQWAYLRAFPAVVPFDSLAELSRCLRGRWRSLCRLTDPFGGAVSTWERQVYHDELLGVGFRADGPPGPLAAATTGCRTPRTSHSPAGGGHRASGATSTTPSTRSGTGH